MIEPAIGYAITNNKLILDDLNDHQDYVEIDMEDVLFIQINPTILFILHFYYDIMNSHITLYHHWMM